MPKHYAKESSSWIWVVALIVVAISILGIIILTNNNGAVDTQLLTTNTISAEDHIRGNKDAKTVLIEYGDYQCPACATYDPLVRQLVQEYGDRVAFVYRHFPLRQIHANTDIAAQAAEAAGLQGKFFEMHAMLYDNQTAWASRTDAKEVFVSYAAKLGLDIKKFENDLTSQAIKDKINKDLDSGVAAGLLGTPTFFLNGKSINNPASYQGFSSLLDQAISKQ